MFTYHPSEGRRESGFRGRPGGLHTIKIRAVCSACNNGWMNALEGRARPLLTPLIEGAPVALDFEHLGIVARWIATKCIVAEHATTNTAVTPEPDRWALRADGAIPNYFRIYVANHNMPHAAGYIRHTLCLGTKGPFADPPLIGTANNVQTISFILGRVFVHLNAARVKDYSLESRFVVPAFHAGCRIWPFMDHEMVWPRRPLLDQRGINLIAGTLQAITGAANVTWTDLG